jgi:hypothetical protein
VISLVTVGPRGFLSRVPVGLQVPDEKIAHELESARKVGKAAGPRTTPASLESLSAAGSRATEEIVVPHSG